MDIRSGVCVERRAMTVITAWMSVANDELSEGVSLAGFGCLDGLGG